MTDIATFDETIRGLSPPRGERLERVRDLDVRIGGAESNVAVAVAVAAARLGCETTWLSRLPASPLARRVTGELRSHGVRRRDGVAEANCRRRCRGRDRQRGRVCDRKRRRGLSR